MQRTICYWRRSNQTLYSNYIGFWFRIFWACYKGICFYFLSSDTSHCGAYYLTIARLPFLVFSWFVLMCQLMSASTLSMMQMYPQGRMSHHFREMKVGDYLSVKGPKVTSFANFWASGLSILRFWSSKYNISSLSYQGNFKCFPPKFVRNTLFHAHLPLIRRLTWFLI
jgi:hypothetical protein